MHNGFIADFHLLRRDLMLAIDPAQFPEVQGSTDSEGRPRSRRTASAPGLRSRTLKALDPDNPRLQRLSEGDRVIVSEPFADLPGAWQEIPEATAVCVRRGGELEERPFVPRAEAPGAGAPRERTPALNASTA